MSRRIPALGATLPHHVAYQLHLEELTARLAQAAGDNLPCALRWADDLQRHEGRNRIQALTETLRTWEDQGEERRTA